jgi:hypothetical protein
MRAQPSRPPDVRAPPLRPRGGVLGAGRVLAEGLAPWDGRRGHRPRIGRDGRRQIARGSAPGGQTCLNATCPAAGHGARTGGFAEARAQHGRPRSRSSNRGHRASGAKPSAGFRSPAPIGRPSGHSSVAASGARGRVPVARLRLVRESRRLRRSVTYDRYGRRAVVARRQSTGCSGDWTPSPTERRIVTTRSRNEGGPSWNDAD